MSEPRPREEGGDPSKGKVRVYEIARVLGLDTTEVMAGLRDAGHPVRNHLATVEVAAVHDLLEARSVASEEGPAPKSGARRWWGPASRRDRASSGPGMRVSRRAMRSLWARGPAAASGEAPRVRPDGVLLRRVAGETKPFRRHVLLTFFLFLLSTPLMLLTPVPLKIAVDSVIGDHPAPAVLRDLLPGWMTSSDVRLLVVVAVLQVLITLLIQLQELGGQVSSLYAGEKMTLRFRSRLFDHVQRMSLQFHDTQGTTESIYRIQYDALSLQQIVIYGLLPLLTASLTLLAMIYVIFKINWQLAIVAVGICPFLYWLFRNYRRRMRPHYHDVKSLESSAMGVMQEVLTALRVVKAFGREDDERDRFFRKSNEGLRARIRLAFAEGTYALIVNCVTAAGTSLVLLIGVLNVRSGALTLGAFLMAVTYLAQLYNPVKTVGRTLASLQSALVGLDRSFELLDEAPDVPEKPDAARLRRSRGNVAFRNVCFSYDGKTPVLRDISFDAGTGARVGILGRTGAGKSTLISLLTRFYDVTGGSILIDGRDVRDYKLADVRNQFAIVLQEPVLLSTSIRENIAYARPGAPEEEIVAAAEAANAHEFIVDLPEGYDTSVGERGMKLSGGQRQRIALARAFLKNAPILILDEPTSSVDVTTEAKIIDAMERLMADRTTFIIAHRLNTLEHCDLLLELEHGRLVGGSPRRIEPAAKAARVRGFAPAPAAAKGWS